MFVQRVQVAVRFLQPAVETPAGLVVEGVLREFVADLPGDDVGVVTEAACQLTAAAASARSIQSSI